jgi:hypothetical protein
LTSAVGVRAEKDVGDSRRRPWRARAGLGLQDQVELSAVRTEAKRSRRGVYDGRLEILFRTRLYLDLIARAFGEHEIERYPDGYLDLILVA